MKEKEFDNPELERINHHYLFQEIKGFLYFEKGYFLTLKNLSIKPAEVIETFLFKNRKRYIKPYIYLILNAIIFELTAKIFNVSYNLFTATVKGNSAYSEFFETSKFNQWASSHLGYTIIILALILGAWLSLFFIKNNLNYFETFILLCYSLGHSLIILTLFTIAGSLLNYQSLPTVGLAVGYLYIIWSLTQFYGRKNILNYLKVLTGTIITLYTYKIFVALISFLFYLIS